MTKENLGKFISENRKALGMTQEELAQKLFVTNKAVSKWEKGQSFPDIALFEPLAEALGVSVAELIACEKKVTEAATFKSLIRENFKKEKTKKYLLAVIFILVILLFYVISVLSEYAEYIERNNYDYVYLDGFYYSFDMERGGTLDERFIGEYIGEVTATGIKRNGNNKSGEAKGYPVGAKVYDVNAEDEEFIRLYVGRIAMGEAAIEIDGTYYRGSIAIQSERDMELYHNFYTLVYGKDYNSHIELYTE